MEENSLKIKLLAGQSFKERVHTFSCLLFRIWTQTFVPTLYLFCHFSRVNWWKMTFRSRQPLIFLHFSVPLQSFIGAASPLFTHQSPPLHSSLSLLRFSPLTRLSRCSDVPSVWTPLLFILLLLFSSPGVQQGLCRSLWGGTPVRRTGPGVKTGCGGEILISSSLHR